MPPDAASPGDRRDAATRIRVLLPLPLSGAFDYAVPADLGRPVPGDFVIAPLGRRDVLGVVWDDNQTQAQTIEDQRLRPLSGRIDRPGLPAGLRRFVEWVAAYTMTPPGAVLRMTLSPRAVTEQPLPRVGYALAEPQPADLRMTPARGRVLDLLKDGRAMTSADLTAAAGSSPAILRGLVTAGALSIRDLPPLRGPDPAQPDWRKPRAALSPDQDAAANDLVGQVVTGGFGVTLLTGVTGSGKTEVYFAAIAAALERGRRVLVLLPEIALSAQWLERFAQRFGCRPAVWHSDLGATARRRTWRDVAEGRVSVLVGARSALFLPLDALGLIVVDEEHDASYKQEDGVIYQARDMAVVRGRIAKVPVVLVSATPSLESHVNARSGRYRRLDLPSRHGGAALPAVVALDMRVARPARGRWIMPPLVDALTANLAAGRQSLLFLNRRGYAPLTLCRACGHRLECHQCSAWLVEHRLLHRLVCHHCGNQQNLPRVCPACAEDSLAACGPGVERLAEEIVDRFPEARLAVMASDLLVGPNAAADLVTRMSAREIDILIGTQMVAKGHHFPDLTVIGVIDADLGLHGGDLRAGERTYQLLHQVAGRAGRETNPGQVYLQTADPTNAVLQAILAGDTDRFLETQAAERELFGMPPFGRLAALILSGPDSASADRWARTLAGAAPHHPDIEILGPAPAPMALLRGRHRRRFLIKARRQVAPQNFLSTWLDRVRLPSNIRLDIDIDPYSFL